MTLNENTVEQAFIKQLVEQHNYVYHYWPDVAPYSDNALRESFDEVILKRYFSDALLKLNPDVSQNTLDQAMSKILNIWSTDIMTNNETFHEMLTNGVDIENFEDGHTRWVKVMLMDVEDVSNNSYHVINQFVIKETNREKRLDAVVFINGLPLVVVELKNATDENATLDKAYTQIQNYKTSVPSIFYYNALCVISDGIDAWVSSVSAGFSRYLAWRSPEKMENGSIPELEIMTQRMFEPETLVKLIRYNTVFEKEEVKDPETGLLSLVTIKKVAAYHQYYAVQKAVQATIAATHETEWDRKIWVIRHTQWSGKSLSMVFYAGQIVVQPEMKNPTIVMLTDRNDLDDQLHGTFNNCVSLLRQTPVQADSRSHLKELLKVSGGGIVFTTIQKFSPEEWNVFDTLSERTNIIVVADEAHRSQYGFQGKEGEEDGKSMIKYGNAKYLRDAIPNASFIWFTGTPIEKWDRSTRAVFGDEIDIYDIKQARDDGATVPLSYESRLAKIRLNEEVAKQIDADIANIEWATEEQLEKSMKRNAKIDSVVGHPDRLRDIAKDITTHYAARQEVFDGKAMIVAMSRSIAVKLYKQIIELHPDRHDDDLMKGKIKVVMTSSSDDPEDFQPHHSSKKERKQLAARLKDPHDELQMVIVRDMWLTGFDAPCLHTMYVDKKMQWANLMQAIARVNRTFKDKPWGLIVDYIGIGQDLRKAMAVYTESWWTGDAVTQFEEIVAGMQEKFEVVEQMFHWFNYKAYFSADGQEKLRVLLASSNFILWDEELRKRFIQETTALSKLFAMATPSFEAEQIRDTVAFFQWVKARIHKFTPTGGKSNAQVDTAIKQIVDDALSSEGVIDIFDAAGIKAPSLDILSPEFLMEVQNMEQKNLAFQLLKKLLNEEVKVRKKTNMTQGKKFSEMLESTIKRYHNNQIDTAQVIQELAEIAEEMKLQDNKAEDLWLTAHEYAFYTVLSENESTKYLEDAKMKELIHVIVDTVRSNSTVDREKRDDVKAKLRLTVKKLLIRYGYPPDLARLEADRVLEQSELLAGEFSK